MARLKTSFDGRRAWWRILASVLAAVLCVVNIVSADEEYSDPMMSLMSLRGRKGKLAFESMEVAPVITEYLPRHHVERRDISSKINKRELMIVTIKQEPYTMITRDEFGNPLFSGFIPELIFKLSRRLRFEYRFREEFAYGKFDNMTQQWSGMIGEVIKNEKDSNQGADMAAAAITITSDRERVVNFVKPFQNLGFSIVIKRPDYTTDLPYTFSIFQPFDPALWGLIILSVVVVGLFLWLMNMYNPYEWAGRYGLGLADKQQSEYFNLAGSLWFVFTSLLWQGFEKAPRSIASKFLGCVWFAFVSIVLVTYTAGIVNHLFWASMVHKSASIRSPFIDLAHLITNKDYKYGVLENGQTYRYLMDVAPGEEFDAIRRYLRSPEGQAQLVKNVTAGVEKVRKEKYAFIMESLMAKHEINRRPCDLTLVGDQFGHRAYGLALPLNSTILSDLNVGLLEMMEEGELEELERKWFVDRNECWNVTVMDRLVTDVASALYVNRPKSVDLGMFWSPLVLVIVGIIASLIIAFAEMMYYRQWGRYKSSNQPQGQQLKMDPDEGNI